ncbi:MAG: DUF2059 domain-containing protein [Pseudomonadota bacterium]
MTKTSIRTRFGLLLSLLFASVPVASQAEEQDSYTQLVNAVASDAIAELVFQQDLVISFGEAFRSDPDVVEVETDCPGYVDGYVKAVRPTLRKAHDLDYVWYRAEMAKLYRAGLTPEEALGAAQFFGSDLGQRLLASAIAQSSGDNTVREALDDEGEDISTEAYNADKRATARNLLNALSAQERQEISVKMGGAPWFPAFQRISKKVNALGLEMVNRELSAEHNAEVNVAIDTFLEAHFATCDTANQ